MARQSRGPALLRPGRPDLSVSAGTGAAGPILSAADWSKVGPFITHAKGGIVTALSPTYPLGELFVRGRVVWPGAEREQGQSAQHSGQCVQRRSLSLSLRRALCRVAGPGLVVTQLRGTRPARGPFVLRDAGQRRRGKIIDCPGWHAAVAASHSESSDDPICPLVRMPGSKTTSSWDTDKWARPATPPCPSGWCDCQRRPRAPGSPAAARSLIGLPEPEGSVGIVAAAPALAGRGHDTVDLRARAGDADRAGPR